MAIVGVSNAVGFRAGSGEIIKKGFFDKIKSQKSFFQGLATSKVKSAFSMFSKQPVDTGYTKETTKATTFWGADKLVIRFKTPNDKGYAIFPLLGLSTSKKYGQRNWLTKGAELTLKELS